MRALTSDELLLIAGGYGDTIVVTGHPPSTTTTTTTTTTTGFDDPPDPYDWGDNGGGGGDGSDPMEPFRVTDHTDNCGSSDGAAVQIGKHIAGTPGGAGPVTTSGGHTYQNVEFSAVVIKNDDGSYGAYQDAIYSSDHAGGSPSPTLAPYGAEGLFHTHPDRGDATQDRVDAFPSRDDWEILTDFAQSMPAGSDPSLWIMGPSGVVHEFKFSEKDTFYNMTTTQLGNPASDALLQSRQRTESCS